MFPFGSVVLLDGTDAKGHRNLWETNGTSAGTFEITIPGIAALDPSNFAALNNEDVMFQGNGAAGGRVLYRVNLTTPITTEIDVPGAFSRGLQPFDIMGLNTGKSLFAGGDPGLWVTDGTTGGTSELSAGINPTSITVLNASKALFNAVNASSKHGLWVSDGTSAGTSELSVAGAASGGLDPTNSVRLRRRGAVRRHGCGRPSEFVDHGRYRGGNVGAFGH